MFLLIITAIDGRTDDISLFKLYMEIYTVIAVYMYKSKQKQLQRRTSNSPASSGKCINRPLEVAKSQCEINVEDGAPIVVAIPGSIILLDDFICPQIEKELAALLMSKMIFE